MFDRATSEATGPVQIVRLTLVDALRRAEEANPDLRGARADVAASEGEYRDSRGALWNNPVLSAERTRRRTPSGLAGQTTSREWNVGISQTFEIAGQAGFRREAARRGLQAAREDVESARAALRFEVERRFVDVLESQKRIVIEREGLRLSEEAANAVDKRVRAGEDTRLDGNLAAVDAERARNQLALLGEQLTRARAELAALLQLPPTILPEAEGDLDASARRASLQDFLNAASANPRLRALRLREDEARDRLDLERASRYPDITIGLATGREGNFDARENLTTLSVSVPLPLFKRNATGIGRATTELERSRIRREAATRDVEATVRSLWARLESLRARVERLGRSVLPRLDENQRLSSTAFRAGEVDLLRLLVVNRQLIDARRDHLEALGELARTRIEIERAANAGGAVDDK